MGTITVLNHLTLDGVMQSPSGPDEDARNGFTHGGWAFPRGASVGMDAVDFANPPAMLFGHRTWQSFHDAWAEPKEPNPFTGILNAATKYVASRTLTDASGWQNSVLLEGDTAAAVRAAKEQEENILVMGSGDLIRSLLPHGVIDRFVLMIHPLVLGSGQRLFDGDGTLAEFTLEGTRTSDAGIIVATYRAA